MDLTPQSGDLWITSPLQELHFSPSVNCEHWLSCITPITLKGVRYSPGNGILGSSGLTAISFPRKDAGFSAEERWERETLIFKEGTQFPWMTEHYKNWMFPETVSDNTFLPPSTSPKIKWQDCQKGRSHSHCSLRCLAKISNFPIEIMY